MDRLAAAGAASAACGSLGTAEAIMIRLASLLLELLFTLSVAGIPGSDLGALLGSVALLVAVVALLVEQKWADHLAMRSWTILHVVALILGGGTLGIIADLAERGLGSSLVAIAAGAVIAAVVVLCGGVHR